MGERRNFLVADIVSSVPSPGLLRAEAKAGGSMNFVLHLIIMISVYVILAESLNLATGYGGMLSLAHAAFFGTGAYAVALLTTRFHVSFFEIGRASRRERV